MRFTGVHFRLLSAVAVVLVLTGVGSLQTARAFGLAGNPPSITCAGFSSFLITSFDDGETLTLTAVDSQGTTLFSGAPIELPSSEPPLPPFQVGPGTWSSIPADGVIILSAVSNFQGSTTFSGLVSGCNIPPGGPPIPPGYKQTVISCNTALYDRPGGNQIPGVVIHEGQTFYTDTQTHADAAGREWIAVFVGGDNVGYILAYCTGGFDPHMPPPHFVTLKSTCNVPVYDKPGGKPLGNYAVKAGQIIAAGLIHYQDQNKKLWNQVMVDQSVVGYVWTVCIDP